MRMRSVATIAIALVSVGFSFAQFDQKVIDGLKWREIGPWRGGRSTATSGVYGRPNEFYMGTTGGGVWKTTDAGETWKCVSDGFFKTGSVGSIAVSPTNPDVVYVGMGERAPRGNITHGDGVYKSIDGGKTWSHMGLKETQYVGRIVVHPKNPDVVWVAAMGAMYGPTKDRGLYKSVDGGKTWKRTLFVSDKAGALDLSFDAKNPDIMILSTYEVWRTAYSLNSGGPGSRLWMSKDGGETWSDISARPGLPSGVLGKIGVDFSPADSNRIYAMIEAKDGGLYRSDDAGATWKLMNSNADLRQRPWYYTRVTADPNNADLVYVQNVSMHKSVNGGQTFSAFNAQHSDNHDYWIDPADSKRMACANDGGVSVSVDNGRNWSEQDYPTAQFYHVSTDSSFPYNVLGAQQDNSTVRIPSRTFTRGITADDWTDTAGGESGYVTPHPLFPEIVFGGSYGGYLTMENHLTKQSRSINPWPDNPMGGGAEAMKVRFQWTFPIVFSPNDKKTMYVGSQYVMKSTDMGGSFTNISPDLTRNDKSKMGSSGGPITQDNTSVEYYGTVFTIAESPKRAGVIWAGSDDGLVHVTLDGGRSWSNVTPKGMPEWGLCSMIEASPHDPAVAFLALDNHENGNDFTPYVYVTRDYGRTWELKTTGIEREAFVRVVREDPVVRGLLFAGTEAGMFVSTNNGDSWQRFQGNLPIVPIHDLVIKHADVVVATHGRSFWILDDIAALRQMAVSRQAVLSDWKLFEPSPGLNVNFGGNPMSGDSAGQNPMSGMIVDYFLPSDGLSVKLEMLDADGVVVATASSAPTNKGMNRTTMSPRYPGHRGFTGIRYWGAPTNATLKAPPGKYKVRMTVGDKSQEVFAIWAKDPRTTASDADLVEQYKFSKRISDRVNEANRALEQIRKVRSAIEESVKGDSALSGAASSLVDGLTQVEEAIYQTKARSGQDFLNFPIRLNNKLAALASVVQSGNFRPTKQSYDVFNDLSKQLDAELKKLAGLLKAPLADLNAKLKAAGKSEITP